MPGPHPTAAMSKNTIFVEGYPFRQDMKIGANATVAKMLPGRFVIYDAAEGSIKEAGAKANPVIAQIDLRPDVLLADSYTVGKEPYQVGDYAPTLRGKYRGKVVLLDGESVTPGDRLVTAADGKVAKLAAGAAGATGAIIAIAQEVAAPSGADEWILADIDTTGGHSIAAA